MRLDEEILFIPEFSLLFWSGGWVGGRAVGWSVVGRAVGVSDENKAISAVN